jgi:type III secretion protein T
VTETPIVEAVPPMVISAMLCLPRMFVFMVVVPLFPSAVFPRMMRIAIALGLGAPVGFGIYHQLGPEGVPPDLVALVLKECVLGLLVGISIAAPFWVVQSVGVLADNQRGANAAQQVTPFSVADSSLLSAALTQAFIVSLATSGAFVLMYELLLHSFEVWPVLQLVPDASQFGFDIASMRFGEFVQRAVLYAAPVVAIIMLVDFAFALMSVFAPQLQTYFASMPIKSLAAIAVLALYLFVLLSHAEGYFRDVFRRESMLLESRSP